MTAVKLRELWAAERGSHRALLNADPNVLLSAYEFSFQLQNSSFYSFFAGWHAARSIDRWLRFRW